MRYNYRRVVGDCEGVLWLGVPRLGGALPGGPVREVW